MSINEIANYIVKKYNQEIIESYYDNKNIRKNRPKDLEKIEWLKSEVKKTFEFPDLITDLKIGPPYNCSDNPWIHVHDIINSKGTEGEYIGISFDKSNNSMEIWMGFGRTGMKKKEVIEKREEYKNKLKNIEPILKRDFKFLPANFNDAVMISKEIKLDEINDMEVKKDFAYLGNLYIKFENKVYEKNTEYQSSYKETLEEIKKIPEDEKIKGENIIYIGNPGSGKTYEIKNKYLILEKDDELSDDYKYEMVVFYPEYSNSDFIGSYIQSYDDGHIKNEFVPGPFSKILRRAIINPKSNFYLIIEEINHGNVTSIFGDILGILDRKDGESIYKISNPILAKYVFNDSNRKIYLPNNLSIIATMNLEEKETYPLDSVIRRRFETRICNQEDSIYDELYIKGLGNIKWGKFRKIINSKLENVKDKKLGTYFINESYLSKEIDTNQEDLKRFIYKVLIYLYDDVCEKEKEIIFNEEIKDIDKLINISEKKLLQVFNTDIRKGLENE